MSLMRVHVCFAFARFAQLHVFKCVFARAFCACKCLSVCSYFSLYASVVSIDTCALFARFCYKA